VGTGFRKKIMLDQKAGPWSRFNLIGSWSRNQVASIRARASSLSEARIVRLGTYPDRGEAVSSPGIGKENYFLSTDELLMLVILTRKSSGNRGAAAGAGAYGVQYAPRRLRYSPEAKAR
jgi:hypothetical protein